MPCRREINIIITSSFQDRREKKLRISNIRNVWIYPRRFLVSDAIHYEWYLQQVKKEKKEREISLPLSVLYVSIINEIVLFGNQLKCFFVWLVSFMLVESQQSLLCTISSLISNAIVDSNAIVYLYVFFLFNFLLLLTELLIHKTRLNWWAKEEY